MTWDLCFFLNLWYDRCSILSLIYYLKNLFIARYEWRTKYNGGPRNVSMCFFFFLFILRVFIDRLVLNKQYIPQVIKLVLFYLFFVTVFILTNCFCFVLFFYSCTIKSFLSIYYESRQLSYKVFVKHRH